MKSLIIEKAKAAFKDENIPAIGEYYSLIERWNNVFRGVPPWAKIKRSGLYKKGSRNMNMLCVAKVLCDEFATQCFAEQVEISCDSDSYSEYINAVLDSEGFWKNFPELLSKAFAAGGCVLREYAENGVLRVDFIAAADFLPTAWGNRRITEGIFQKVISKGGSFYTLFEKHGFDSTGNTIVENRLFKSGDSTTLGTRCSMSELFEGVPDIVIFDMNVPAFQYFRGSSANNKDDYNPLGISVFANALDTLKALDIAFDSFSREFILGKKRIIVLSSCIRTVTDPLTGNQEKYFDADDEVFVALKCDEDKDLHIQDNTTALRIDEHVSAINALLNILCFQVGMSAGSLSFDSHEGMKTATEVVSMESKTARTMKSNKNLLAEFLEEVCHAIIALGISLGSLSKAEYTLTIGFKDNIVVDDNALIDNNIKLVTAGLKSKLSAVMEILKCDEGTAKKELERVAKEEQVTGGEIDSLGAESP